jgi:hypothetical protein
MAGPTASLRDTFDDGTIDTAQWGTSGGVTESGGVAVIPCTAAYPSLYSADSKDLTGSFFYAAITIPAFGTGTRQNGMQLLAGGNNNLEWYADGTYLFPIYKIAGVQTTLATLTYSPGTHRWWRIRHSGSTVYWDTSANGREWIQRASATTPITITALTAAFSSGYYGAESAADMTVDNVNVYPVTAYPLPIAVDLRLGASHVRSGAVGTSTQDSGGGVWSADKAAYDVTAVLDVQVDVTPTDWTPPQLMTLAGKYLAAGNQRSWVFYVNTNGTLEITWSPDGTFASALSATSTVAVGAANNSRKAVRCTLWGNTGIQREARFYTADTVAGTWTQLGATVTGATTSVFAGTADLTVGGGDGNAAVFASASTFTGKIHGFAMYSGIKELGGTRVAYADFTRLRPGVETFTDLDENEWAVEGSSVVVQEWTDVTVEPVYARSKIEIGRGRANETSQADPSRCGFELADRGGDFSPRNPAGAHYGRIGRNTPARVSLDGSVVALLLHRAVHDYAFTRDSAGLSITGDIDLRVDVALTSWSGLPTVLCAKYVSPTAHSWNFALTTGGFLALVWSADGTTDLTATSTVAVPLPHHGRKAVRATLDVNNGAAGKTVTFYTAEDMDSSWTQLGDAVTTSGTTSIFNGSDEVRLLGYDAAYTGGAHAILYEAEIRNGIGGSLAGSPAFTSAAAGAASVTDGQGNVWDLAGSSEVADRDWRFCGEVSSWPVERDTSGRDVWVAVDAGGVLRRLGQGASPVSSTMYRGLTSRPEVVEYWPCEDSDGATSIASGLAGRLRMAVSGAPSFASSSVFACSKPLPTLGESTWFGRVVDYANPNFQHQWWFLLAVPSGGVSANCIVARTICIAGTAVRWELSVSTAGGLRLQAFNDVVGAGSSILDTGFVAFAVNGELLRVSVGLDQDGADIDYFMHTLEVGASSGLAWTGTLAGNVLGRVTSIEVNPGRVLTDTVVGHVSVHDEIISLFDLGDELGAYAGEAAGGRVLRLCAENGVEAAVVGGVADTAAMGSQLPKTLVELLRECETADGGILYEPREFLGLSYRTRLSMCAQEVLAGAAAVELDYGAADLSEFRPVDDDRATRNDVTASRAGGASARAVEESGPLSVLPPPDGVGVYDEDVAVNVETDDQLPDQAGWRRHLGTADEARHPAVRVNLARAPFTASAVSTAAVRALDVGGLVTVTDPPADLPPDDIRQVAQGFSETLDAFEHSITVNCAPASPWEGVGVYDAAGTRYSPDGSHLGADATSGATSITVTTPTGPVWDDADQPYDLMVGGERVTVTAVSGATSPQTLTVTRSVNGVVRGHSEGEEVRLFQPAYYGF